MGEERKLGIALVGLGNYSQSKLTPALKETENCYLAGVVTGTPEKADKYIKNHNIKESNVYNYDNFDEIADNPEIDIVYVVLPNSMHEEFTIRAAEAGKHVICEKPMANSVEEAERMIDACTRNNVRLFIGYRLHYEPFNREIRKLQANKKFGEVTSIQTENSFAIANENAWRLDKKLAGGGPLMDAGIYSVQAARYATGMEPVRISAEQKFSDDPKFKGIEAEIEWEMEFPDSVIAHCKSSYLSSNDYLLVSYEHGWARLDKAFTYSGKAGKTSEGKLEFPDLFEQVQQLDGMCEELIHNKPTTASGEEGLQDMRVIEAIYQAAETGKKVAIPELITV